MSETKAMRNRLLNRDNLPYLMIILGNIVMTFAYANWMVPNTILNGGMTSIAMVLQVYIDIPIAYLVNGLLSFLLLLCLLFLGRRNFFRSLLSSVTFMIFFSFFEWLPIDAMAMNWFPIDLEGIKWYSIDLSILYLIPDLLLSSIFIAFGVYCCLASNSSSVSVDVIALIIHKYYPKTNVAKSIRLLNMSVLGIGFLVLGWQSVVVGLIFTYLFTYFLNLMLQYWPRFAD